MSAAIASPRGWCPGALEPMPTGDGLLARIRPPLNRLSLAQAFEIAACAAEFGNCVLEISARANLQMRGITEAGLAALQKRLGDVGLLDANPRVERARNILVSPLGDVDPAAATDAAPFAREIETRLQYDIALQALPAKFSFAIDGGGALNLSGQRADVVFAALSRTLNPVFEIALDAGRSVVAHCAGSDIAVVASRLARAFLDLSKESAARRMKALVADVGAAAVFARAGLIAEAPSRVPPRPPRGADYLSVRAIGAEHCVGLAAPLGRMRAADFGALAARAHSLGARDLRLTPWRTLIATGLSKSAAQALALEAQRGSFILAPDDPILAIVACSGAPACAAAARDVQADARTFAAAMRPGDGILLHVSGCAKGCAHAGPAPLTLVATDDGYDLVRNGRAGDAPDRSGLSLGEAREAILDCR